MSSSLRDTLFTMRSRGGAFTSRLADAWLHADGESAPRLAYAFPDLIEAFAAKVSDSPGEEEAQQALLRG